MYAKLPDPLSLEIGGCGLRDYPTTPDTLTLLDKHNIIAVQVPAHCTDKLQPMDISINKPVKDEMKKRFQSWYTAEL